MQMKIKEKVLWINAKSQKSETYTKLCKVLRNKEIFETEEIGWLSRDL